MEGNVVEVPPRKRIRLSLPTSSSYPLPSKNTENSTCILLSQCSPFEEHDDAGAERQGSKRICGTLRQCYTFRTRTRSTEASDNILPFRRRMHCRKCGNGASRRKEDTNEETALLSLIRPRGYPGAGSSSLLPHSFMKHPKRLRLPFCYLLGCALKRVAKGWYGRSCMNFDMLLHIIQEVLHYLLNSMDTTRGDMILPLIKRELSPFASSLSLYSRRALGFAVTFALQSICSPQLSRCIQIWCPGDVSREGVLVPDHQLVSISQMAICIQKTCGKSSPNVSVALVSSIFQAEQLYHRKAFAEAKHLYQMALNLHNESFGCLGPLTTYLLNRLGNLCSEIQDFDDALSYYYDGLNVEQCLHGEGSAEVLVTTTNIACIHRQRGQYDSALKYFIRACEIQAILEGPTSLQVALTHANIGLMWFQLGFFEYSYEAYCESLRIRQLHCSKEGSLIVASSLNAVGLSAFKIGRYSEARSCIIRSFEMAKRFLREDNEELAVLASNVATVLAETGETGSSVLPYYLEVLRIERSRHGAHHPNVVGFMVQVGHNLEMLGERENAIKIYEDALQIERQREDRDFSRMILLLRLIGNIQLQMGSITLMMDSFAEASRLRQQLQGSCLLFASTGLHLYCLDKINPLASPVA